MKENQNPKLWIKVIEKLALLFSTKLNHKDWKNLGCSLALLHKWSKCEGAQGVKRWKSISDNLLRRRLLRENVPVQTKKGLKYKRIPRCFSWAFKHKGSLSHTVFTVSLLYYHRAIYTRPQLDLTSITQPPVYNKWSFLKLCYNFWNVDIWEKTQVFNLKAPKWEFKTSISSKAGPQGRPAWKAFLEDFDNLWKSALFWPFVVYFLSSKNKTDRDNMIGIFNFMSYVRLMCKDGLAEKYFVKRYPSVHSRLALLSDKSGKTRVIAVCDSFSQMLLRPLHDQIFSFLRSISRMDGTFDQDKLRRRVKEWNRKGVALYAYDLSSATDRLPVWFQAVALFRGNFLNLMQAIAWVLFVAKRREFHTPDGKSVKYKVGQPMGLLSSWASLAYTHHAIVWWASKLAGHDAFTKYVILGDDIVIADGKVAEEYLKILNALGVEVSIPKSWVSTRVTEFAKSLFLEGMDVSPVPLALLEGRPAYFYQDSAILLHLLRQRGIWPDLKTYFTMTMLSIPKGAKGRGHIASRLLSVLTCPYAPSHYKVDIWPRNYETHIDFLKLARAIRAIKWSDITNIHNLAGSDPLIEICYRSIHSPYIRKAQVSSDTMPGMHVVASKNKKPRVPEFMFTFGEEFTMHQCLESSNQYFPLNMKRPDPLKDVEGDSIKVLRKKFPLIEICRYTSILGYSDETWSYLLYTHGDQTE